MLVFSLLVITCIGGTCTSATAASSNDSIGIKLVDAPVNRRDDPRAQVYIVDHLAPGTTIKRRVLVTNNAPTPRVIEMYPGAAAIQNNTFNGLAGHATNDLTSWISLDTTTLDLPPNGSAEVMVTIAVAPTASQGEQYGVIWAETSSAPSAADSVVMISRVGIRLYLDIGAGGEPRSDFTVRSLTPARTKAGQPEVLADVSNIGGRALDMSGQMSLSGGPGSLNAGPFPVTGGTTLLPGHTAPVQVVLDKNLPNGPWKVTLTLQSGSITHTVTSTITFPPAGMGKPVAPDSWFHTHLLLVIGLAVMAGAALALAIVLTRRRLAHRPSLS